VCLQIGSPIRARHYTSAPQTPTYSGPSRGVRGRRSGNPYGHRSQPSSDYIGPSIVQAESPNIPPFLAATTEPFLPGPLEPPPAVFGAGDNSGLFQSIETRQPFPVYASTYSSLEGWDGVVPPNTRGQSEIVPTLYSAGGETITSASNSPITPPYQQFRFDTSQQPSPAPLTGPGSEYIDSQWSYDGAVFEIGAQTYGQTRTSYQEDVQLQSEVPCSPGGVQNLAGHIHGLAISSGQMAPPYDHRQRSMSLDSSVHHPLHNAPQLIHLSSQNNFKNL
jgi:hypothetical protein